MGSRDRRVRNREGSANSPDPIRPDHFDIRSHQESSRIREREERRQTRWEEDKRKRANERRSKSRNRDKDRVERRGRRSKSIGRRSRSIEERRSLRFQPLEENESRRRSVSRDRRRRRRPSQDHGHMENEMGLTRYTPPGTPQFPPNNMQGPFPNAIPNSEIWRQMQSAGPMEGNMSIGNQGLPPIQQFGTPQNMIMNQPFMENQEFPPPILNLGIPPGPEFPGVPNMPNIPNPNIPSQNVPENDLPIIPEFNPEMSKLTSHEWIKLIEDTGKQHNWKKDEKQYIMSSRLAGFARQWYLTIGINFKTWGELKSEFFKAFPTEMEYYTLIEKMIARKREESEKMSTYFHHKVALLNACEIFGRKAVSCIIGGIPNAKLRSEAIAQKCEDPDTLYMFLRSYTEPPTSVAKNQKVADEPKKTIVKKEMCFLCRVSGRPQATCPHKCSQAQVEEPEEVEKPSPTHNNVMHGFLSYKPTYPKYFTTVSLNGRQLQGYVDQASENTTIREHNAFALGLSIKKQYKVISGFCGSNISSTGVAGVTITIDKAKAIVMVYVVPDHIQAIPIIVGQSFTEQQHVMIMKDGAKVRFYQRMENGSTNFDYK